MQNSVDKQKQTFLFTEASEMFVNALSTNFRSSIPRNMFRRRKQAHNITKRYYCRMK